VGLSPPFLSRGGTLRECHLCSEPDAANATSDAVSATPQASPHPQSQTDPGDDAPGRKSRARVLVASRIFRPSDLAEAPDGSLYVSDDRSGRIWRILYVGK